MKLLRYGAALQTGAMTRMRSNSQSEVRITAGSLRVVHIGPVGRPLLVIHGGPDWDHSYLIPAVSALVDAGVQPILFDIRGCGGSMRCDHASGYR